jgi:hypothetical protein
MSGLIAKVQQFAIEEPCGCWRWVGARSNGVTPSMQWLGRVDNVRRHILRDRGAILTGYLAGTSCGNPTCVNPDHVVKMTRSKASKIAADAMDAASKLLRAKNISAGRKKYAKLTAEQADAIRVDTRPQRTIAAEYGVAQWAVYAIKSGRTWKTYSSGPFSGLMR